MRISSRLHAGYSFAAQLPFKPLHASSRPFKNRLVPHFLYFREPERTRVSCAEHVQLVDIALPKPGVRGSIPFRDASFSTISGVQTCTLVNGMQLRDAFT